MDFPDSTDALAACRQLRKAGNLPAALTMARRIVPELEPGQVAQLGKLLQKDLAHPEAGVVSGAAVSVLVLGQCTTNYLPPLLAAWAWAEGVRVDVRDGAYDQMLQELMALDESRAPAVVILLPWHQRLLGEGDRGTAERISDELAFHQQVWGQVRRLKCKMVQVSYDWVLPGPLGFTLSSRRGGAVALVQQINAALREELPAGAHWVDLEALSAWHGKGIFYDERNYHWLKQPFSPTGLSALGRMMAVAVRVLTTGRRKVLVLDLDNTLWGGVVGEVGAQGIVVGGAGEGQAFAAFQKHLKALKGTGVVLTVASKNNPEDAREPFEKNEAMVLRLDDFASFHASWDPKPESLRRMAVELNLGLDSFVFFDDNPAERARMRAELPEVTVVEVPPEPDGYLRALQVSLAFETTELTSADADRAAQYVAEGARRAASGQAASPEAYLASLGMVAEVHPLSAANLDRVIDLITKTNQFNLTTRRHSRSAVEAMMAEDRSVCFAVSLRDKFGDYGLIAVVLGTPEDHSPDALRLDTWLMSCRAMGRTVEHRTLNEIVQRALQAGYTRVLGEYLPTPKNTPVAKLLPDFGFSSDESATGRWWLEISGYSDLPTQVF